MTQGITTDLAELCAFAVTEAIREGALDDQLLRLHTAVHVRARAILLARDAASRERMPQPGDADWHDAPDLTHRD